MSAGALARGRAAVLISFGLVLAVLATYAEAEDLLRIGAYVKGSSAAVDRAVELMPQVDRFLRQGVSERSSFEQTRGGLLRLAEQWPFE